MTIQDTHGRTPSYLRMSITDRCNLSCLYCRGENPVHISHAEILRYEELLRLAKAASRLGIGKIRITGGEPFARKDCMKFLGWLREALPDTRLCVTTNGTLLEPHIDALATLRPESVNVSLDALDPEVFKKIAGKDLYGTVISNIHKLLAKNVRVKLNAVILAAHTPGQLDAFINFARDYPVDVRFIEFMPMGKNTVWTPGAYLSAADLLAMLKEKIPLRPAAPVPGEKRYAGPAQMHESPGFAGRFGFITPISSHFCAACNRVRITSHGRLRMCLFDDREFDLVPLLRDEKADEAAIAHTMGECLRTKPIGADILARRAGSAVASKNMDGIGG